MGAKDQGHFTLWQRVEKTFLVRMRCFKIEEFEQWDLGKKGLDFVIVCFKKVVGEFFFQFLNFSV